MTTLNEFHLLNWQRMASGVFGPPHDIKELCVGSLITVEA